MISLISFKITPLKLPDNVELRMGHAPTWSSNQKEIEGRLFGKAWTVAGIKPNTGDVIFGTGGMVTEPYFTNLSCNLFLLVREGEVPIWWPEICCEVVKEELVK